MFDISLGEIAFVAVIAIVAIGPKELPTVLRALGKWMSQWKGLMRELREGWDELTEELDELPPHRIKGDDGTYYEAYDISDLDDLSARKPASKKEDADV